MKKSISFLMPSFKFEPVGGFKIVFEYANMLSADGYKVHIVYGDTTKYIDNELRDTDVKIPVELKLKLLVKHILFKLGVMHRSARIWYPLDKKIKEYNVYSLCEKYVPNTDIYVCTSVETAKFLSEYKIAKERKFYFIQDYESWGRSGICVRNTYRYGMRNIVISEWLRKIVEDEEHQNCIVVPNSFNPREYYLTIPIEEKRASEISMLYHCDKRKGCEISFKALSIVKKRIPELHCTIFGTPPRPDFLPLWYDYYQCPTHDIHLKINNEAAIYVAASINEGWGLTIGEAMMCGQAVCCTDADGFLEMVVDKKNALISPIKDYEALAKNIIMLIENDDLRHKLAKQGYIDIQNFSQEKSYVKFKRVINL